MIDQKIIKYILQNTKLENIIQEFISLKKIGDNYRGLSPFSNEKTPSFIVSPKKQLWKDFSSGKGGNIITFLMEHEKFTYIETIKWLAKKYNIDIKDKYDHISYKKRYNEKIFELQELAKNIFINNLYNTQEAIEYLKKRKITKNSIITFEIGYSINKWKGLIEILQKHKFTITELEESGLIIKKNQYIYDRFRNRIMFPIHSITGRILGFGARCIHNDHNYPKYLNSIHNEIFNKSQILYGIKQSKEYIIKHNSCYLVEGYIDLISLHQMNIKNVVASSGTALTIHQINIIKRFTNNIIIIYDGDDAGLKATLRSIKLIIEQEVNTGVIILPENIDPDLLCQMHTNESLLFFLKNNVYDIIDFFFKKIINKNQDKYLISYHINHLLKIINKISNNITKELFIQKLSHISKIEEKFLYQQIVLFKNKKIDIKQTPVYKNISKENCILIEIEKKILQLILLYGNKKIIYQYNEYYIIPIVLKLLNKYKINFSIKEYKIILQIIKDGYIKNELRTINFFNKIAIAKNNIQNILSNILISDKKQLKYTNTVINKETMFFYIQEMIIRYKIHHINIIINDLKIKIKNKQTTNKEKNKIILLTLKKIELNKTLRRIL